MSDKTAAPFGEVDVKPLRVTDFHRKPLPHERSVEDALKEAERQRAELPHIVQVYARDWDRVILADALKAAHAAARNDALEEAAAFQEVRAQLRHGYDKYEDAAAIRALKAAR